MVRIRPRTTYFSGGVPIWPNNPRINLKLETLARSVIMNGTPARYFYSLNREKAGIIGGGYNWWGVFYARSYGDDVGNVFVVVRIKAVAVGIH